MRNSIHYYLFVFVFILLLSVNFSLQAEHKHSHHSTELKENWWENLVETSTLISLYNDSSFDAWSTAGNVANFAQIPEIKKVTLPVLVNLIFIGFDGFGNQMFKLTEEQLEPWFGHIEHTLNHLIAPVGEEQTTISTYKTKDVPIEYRFHYNLVNLSPLFDTILQDYILWNTRPERPSNSHDDFYEFARHFNLSIDADDLILDDDDGYDNLNDYNSKSLLNDDFDDFLFSDDNDDDNEVDSEEKEKEAEFDFKSKKKYYVNADHVSSFLQASIKALGLDDTYSIVIINPEPPVNKDEIYGYRTGFSDQELDVLYDIANPNPDEILENLRVRSKPCEEKQPDPIPSILHHRFKDKKINIVDYHLASDQFAQWYLLKQNDPNRPSFNQSAIDPDDPSLIFNIAYGDYKSIFDLAKHIIESGSDSEKNYLYNVIKGGDDYVNENCLVESWISNSRMAFFDINAGPFTWGPLIASEGSKTEKTLPRVPKYRKVEEHTASNIELEREYHTIQSYFSQNCIDVKNNDIQKYCDKLLQSMQENRQKASADIKQKIAGDLGEGEGVDQEIEMFLSKLSAVLSHSIRELIAPPTSLLENPFSLRIKFRVYFITTHNTYETRGENAFDFEEFQKEVERLKFTNQEYTFSITEIKMKESTEISTAFFSSFHSSVIPTLSTSGYFYSESTNYIDSKQLRDNLLNIRSFASSSQEKGKNVVEREIPIFIFSVDSLNPILIDKYYEAKALNDMILAVQNEQQQFRSRYSCNQKNIQLNLRNPIKQLLSAVAISVGGIIPTHITYNAAHSNAMQSWLWSVGGNPLSQTSRGHRFNEFQIDIAKRNQIVNSLDKSIAIYNNAVKRLQHLLTNVNNKGAEDVLRDIFVDLKNLYLDATEIITTISANVAVLNFVPSAELIVTLDFTVRQFDQLAYSADVIFEAYECLPILVSNTDSDTKVMLLIPILFIVLNISVIILILLCRGRTTRKHKVN